MVARTAYFFFGSLGILRNSIEEKLFPPYTHTHTQPTSISMIFSFPAELLQRHGSMMSWLRIVYSGEEEETKACLLPLSLVDFHFLLPPSLPIFETQEFLSPADLSVQRCEEGSEGFKEGNPTLEDDGPGSLLHRERVRESLLSHPSIHP